MAEDVELVEAMRQVVRRFAEDRIAPRVDALERGEERPYALIREMAVELGFDSLVGPMIEAMNRRAPRTPEDERPRRPGPLEQPGLLASMLCELARVNPGFALSFGASLGLFGQTVLRHGTPAQRERWARPVLTGEKVGAWALTEPAAGSDAFALRSVARAVDGGFRLSGEKTFITNAPDADAMIVYARVQGGAADGRLAAFVVERGMEGLATSSPFEKMGMRSSPTGAIHLDDVFVTPAHVLGLDLAQDAFPTAGSRRTILESLLSERVGLCGLALGIIDAAVERALRYAKERVQFGQPIAQFQAVQLRLARMWAARETAQAVFERAIRIVGSEAPDPAALCAAKYTTSTLATEVALDAVQVLGGNGYMQAYRVEGLARDAKLLEIGGGTSDIQLLAIARQVLA